MACGGCMQARAHLVHSARRLDIRGAAAAIRQGVMINVDKARGINPNTRRFEQPATPAKPYQRQVPERST